MRFYFTNSGTIKKSSFYFFLNVPYLNVFCLENLPLFPNLKTSLDLKENRMEYRSCKIAAGEKNPIKRENEVKYSTTKKPLPMYRYLIIGGPYRNVSTKPKNLKSYGIRIYDYIKLHRFTNVSSQM